VQRDADERNTGGGRKLGINLGGTSLQFLIRLKKRFLIRLRKNIQMQGARSPEE